MLKLCKAEGYKYVKKMFLMYNATDIYRYSPTWEWCVASWEKQDNDSCYKTGWHYASCYKTQAKAKKAAAAYAEKRSCSTRVFHHSQLVFRYESEFQC